MEMGDEVEMQKRKIMWTVRLILMAIFLMPSWGWGATYYVVPSGAGTQDGLSWANAFALPATAVTAGNTDVGGDGPHIMYIASGTYNNAVVLTDSDWINGTLIGTSAVGTISPATKGAVLIVPGAAKAFTVSIAGVTLQNISATGNSGANALLDLTGANFVGENLYLYDSSYAILYSRTGATNFNFKRSKFAGCNISEAFAMYNDSSGTIDSCIFSNSDTKYLIAASGAGISNQGAGIVNVRNCLILGSLYSAARNSSTGQLNLTNCIIGNATEGDVVAVNRSNGTLSLTNTFIIPSAHQNHYVSTGAITDGGGNNFALTTSLGFVRYPRIGFFIPNMDDVTNSSIYLDYAESVEVLLSARGMKGSLFLTGQNLAWGTYNYLSRIQDIVDRGTLSISVHGWTHVPYNLTSAGSITKGGATFTVNRAADTITTSDSSVTIAGFRSKLMGQTTTANSIAKAFTDGGWTVSYAASFYDNSGYYNHGEILADGTGTVLTLLIDTTNTGSNITGFFKDQIYDFKVWLEANIPGLTVNTIGGPGGITCAASETAIKNMGFIANRNWASGDTTKLSSLNVYKTSVRQSETIRNDYAAQDTVSMGFWLASYGHLLHFNSHSETDTTLAAWATILDTLKQYNEITVTDFSTAAGIVRASPWTTADDITYTRTWTDQSDFHLLAGSPCIDSGTATGLGANFPDFDGIAMTDGAGNALGAGVDIGCYNFAGHGANGPGQGGQGLMIELIDPLELLQFRFACLSPIVKIEGQRFLDIQGIKFEPFNISPCDVL